MSLVEQIKAERPGLWRAHVAACARERARESHLLSTTLPDAAPARVVDWQDRIRRMNARFEAARIVHGGTIKLNAEGRAAVDVATLRETTPR